MRAASVLVGFLLLSGSAYAADMKVTQPVQDAKAKIVLAAMNSQQLSLAATRLAKAPKSDRNSKIDRGDSRLNDYRLERESCCGPQ